MYFEYVSSLLRTVNNFDTKNLGNIIVSLLNKNEIEEYKLVEFESLFVKDLRYIKYYLITNSDYEFKDHLISSYSEFLDILKTLENQFNTFILKEESLDFSKHNSIKKLLNFSGSLEDLKFKLEYITEKINEEVLHYIDKMYLPTEHQLYCVFEYLKNELDEVVRYREMQIEGIKIISGIRPIGRYKDFYDEYAGTQQYFFDCDAYELTKEIIEKSQYEYENKYVKKIMQ